MNDFRSDCPIASALSVIGDRWSLVIIRDMLFGAHRFSQFVNSAEGIKRNILTDRLVKLEERGLITRKKYQDRPPRFDYRLTPKGAELLPVVQEIAKWGAAHLDHTYKPPDALMEWLPGDFYPQDVADV